MAALPITVQGHMLFTRMRTSSQSCCCAISHHVNTPLTCVGFLTKCCGCAAQHRAWAHAAERPGPTGPLAAARLPPIKAFPELVILMMYGMSHGDIEHAL